VILVKALDALLDDHQEHSKVELPFLTGARPICYSFGRWPTFTNYFNLCFNV
jgi:hypothetical protein